MRQRTVKKRFMALVFSGCSTICLLGWLASSPGARNEIVRLVTEEARLRLADGDRVLGRIGKRILN